MSFRSALLIFISILCFGCDGAEDAAAEFLGVAGTQAALSDLVNDGVRGDSNSPDVPTGGDEMPEGDDFDTPGMVIDSENNAVSPDAPGTTTPGPYERCEDGNECLSSYCVPNPEGARVCTELCGANSDCPQGWECAPVANTRPDTVLICVAKRQSQCLPCNHDGDCGADDRCVAIGSTDRCAQSCRTVECPDETTCTRLQVEGVNLDLCIPDAGTCELCMDRDGDGYGNMGDCLGPDCDDEDPSTHPGADELCDGINNDCDTATDENPAPPAATFTCLSNGICSGTEPTCTTGEWACAYPEGYVADGETACNEADDDCDGRIDEDFDTQSMLAHCGGCNHLCETPNATARCDDGVCTVQACDPFYWNLDNSADNGCEYQCSTEVASVESCNGIDDDCDGRTDEVYGGDGEVVYDDRDGTLGLYLGQACGAGACAGGEVICDPNDTEVLTCSTLVRAAVEICDLADNDCNGIVDDGFDLQTDVRHCGMCNVACTSANATPLCAMGICVLGPCATDYADCDSDGTTGCEAHLRSDPAHCGRCGIACNNSHGETECIDGLCSPVCDDGFADCDGDLTNGCETSLGSDAEHCGGCNRTCLNDHGDVSCRDGRCVPQCDEKYGDCDGQPRNGCEQYLSTLEHCAACGQACALSHAVESCAGGRCRLLECVNDFADCDQSDDNGCEVDTRIDPEHCGGCGRQCTNDHGATQCIDGVCVPECNDGYADCDGIRSNGCESHVRRDPAHCGACGLVCRNENGDVACSDGVCAPTCAGLYGDCDENPTNGCEQSLDTLFHCNGCGVECDLANGTETCEGGRCALVECLNNFADCDNEDSNGCEVDVRSAVSHCGGCGQACLNANGSAACVNARCQPTCDDNFADCDGDPTNGCETNLLTDVNHCGGCGDACANPNGGVGCAEGQCTPRCDPLFGDCDGRSRNGCEQSLETTAHCNECGQVCDLPNSSETCARGNCEIVRCAQHFADCDAVDRNGCEVDLRRDSAHCGRCGFSCTNPNGTTRCISSVCEPTCSVGFADCDDVPSNGCEIDTDDDVTHCGQCDHLCVNPNGVTQCNDGVCAPTCADGFLDCDGDPDNGCERSRDSVFDCNTCLGQYQWDFEDRPDEAFADTNCDGIDGDYDDAIFVSGIGDDANQGLGPESAMASIQAGIDKAQALGRSQVLVAVGTYSADTGLILKNGVSLYGGFAEDFQTRSDTLSTFTTEASTGMSATNLSSETVVDGLEISVANQSDIGQEAVGLIVQSAGSFFTMRNGLVQVGRGGTGYSGPASPRAAAGTAGGSAGTGNDGGAGGVSGGGKGGNGRRRNSGLGGSSGTSYGPNGFGAGGGGGSGAGSNGCFDGSPAAGGSGGQGQPGAPGQNGAAGGNTGTLVGVDWRPFSGSDGSPGGRGGGGGGGGAGAGENCTACLPDWLGGGCGCGLPLASCGTGRGGGGGGGGGRGGAGGAGGGGGGASIGLIARDSALTLENVDFVIALGGRGGNGAAGGQGGRGGAGGLAGSDNSSANGRGGPGGSGGEGGAGGCGGPGAGGPSYVAWLAVGGSVQRVGGSDVLPNVNLGAQGGNSCSRVGDRGHVATYFP